jgi:hypothetical protein
MEMLVTIAIIIVVAALTLGAILGVMTSQNSKAAEETLDKLGSLLEHQWKAVIDDARKEYQQGPPPPGLLAAANNNTDTAQKLWTQLRLQQEFPTSFSEATSPITDPSKQVTLQPKSYYVRALTGVSTANTPPTWQSSVCLYLALAQTRRGMKGRVEESLGQAPIQTVNGMQVFVDPWGTPIGYRRINNGLNPEVFSAGPNRIAGDNDDLSSVRLRQAGARGD